MHSSVGLPEKSSEKYDADRKLKGGEVRIVVSASEFLRWKASSIGKADLSKKGSVDEEIAKIVNFINDQADYFTTSSCSGRILVCSDEPQLLTEMPADTDTKSNSKKDCTWYFVSHSSVNPSEVVQTLKAICGPSKLKFEPFVLHVQCRTVEGAKVLHHASVNAGFRNSGISFGKGGRKIIAAVRGTACLEVPITDMQGDRLTSDAYVDYITKLANQKLEANFKMIKAFERNLLMLLNNKHKPELITENRPYEVYRRKGKSSKKDWTASQEVLEVDSSCLFNEYS